MLDRALEDRASEEATKYGRTRTMSNTPITEQLVARAAQQNERPLHVFKVPESLHHHGIKELGLVELTLDEEMRATQRARGDAIKLASEFAKECLRMVDGQPVRSGDGSADRAMAKMHPKLRQLLLQGYSMLHQTKAEENVGFLMSHEVRVG